MSLSQQPMIEEEGTLSQRPRLCTQLKTFDHMTIALFHRVHEIESVTTRKASPRRQQKSMFRDKSASSAHPHVFQQWEGDGATLLRSETKPAKTMSQIQQQTEHRSWIRTRTQRCHTRAEGSTQTGRHEMRGRVRQRGDTCWPEGVVVLRDHATADLSPVDLHHIDAAHRPTTTPSPGRRLTSSAVRNRISPDTPTMHGVQDSRARMATCPVRARDSHTTPALTTSKPRTSGPARLATRIILSDAAETGGRSPRSIHNGAPTAVIGVTGMASSTNWSLMAPRRHGSPRAPHHRVH
jgi:hypothetical protein